LYEIKEKNYLNREKNKLKIEDSSNLKNKREFARKKKISQ
jgi:hypothetical protein